MDMTESANCLTIANEQSLYAAAGNTRIPASRSPDTYR